MNRFLIATAGVAALSMAAPASAQSGDLLQRGIESILGGSRTNLDARLNDLNLRIQSSYQRGDISRRDATRLQGEVTELSRREQAYRSGGVSRDERNDLQQRLQVLEGRVQQASYDRGDRYDRDDRDDRDGRWADNDRRYNGRDRCPPGLERKDNGCQPPGQAMRTGDRYGNQYARVPASYGERYRDTQRYLYRYNDGRIYQVDRRTGRIVNVTTARR